MKHVYAIAALVLLTGCNYSADVTKDSTADSMDANDDIVEITLDDTQDSEEYGAGTLVDKVVTACLTDTQECADRHVTMNEQRIFLIADDQGGWIPVATSHCNDDGTCSALDENGMNWSLTL